MNAISLTMEMLRIIPLIKAFIRKYLSPNLTEKERGTTVWGISPLSDPGEFDQAATLASVVSSVVYYFLSLRWRL